MASGEPRLQAPPGATDTHMHFYGPYDRYPAAPTAVGIPPVATVEHYRALQRRLGLERVVVVQPTTFGDDNRCTLDAVAELGAAVARAVVVVTPEADGAKLERLTRAGARGIRYHKLPGGVLTWDMLEPMAARVREHAWHVQLQLDGRLLPEKADVLKRLPGTLVIDHVGKFLEPVPPDDPAFRVLLDLVEGGRTWVKLSAPYEVSKAGPPRYDDVGRLAKTLVEAAPERMLWASNWPHPGQTGARRPDDAALLDLLLHWVDDDTTRARILVDNPAALYGF